MKKLNLFGVVYAADDCINATAVADFLSSLDANEEFEVYINSPGGSVFEGLAIYNLLSEYQSRMTIKVVGEASSIASVITCAGAKGKVLIAETALMLIHKPWTVSIGNEDDFKKLNEQLDTIKNSIMSAYSRKSGLDNNKINELMTESSYHNATNCVGYGFADSVYIPSEEESKSIDKSNKVKNELLTKYAMLGLSNFNKTSTSSFQTENNNDSITNEGDSYMNFKNLEDAVIEVGKLQSQMVSFESDLKAARKESEDFKAEIAKKDAEILALNETVKNAEEANFANTAKLFCAQMVSEGKLTKAELQSKEQLLIEARSNTKLVEMLKADIQSRTAISKDYLGSNVASGYNALADNDDFLVNFVENIYNKGR